MTTSAFDTPVYGWRLAPTVYGDTLQAIALREMGDAALWWRLIALNDLVPPFITDTASLAGPGVILTGSLIKIPTPAPTSQVDTTDPDLVFQVDALLVDGELQADANGDLALVSGRDNLAQALMNAIETSRGELLFHPTYGSRVRSLIGAMNGPTAGLLAAKYAEAAVAADPRVQRVISATASVNGDSISVSVEVQPIAGRSVAVTATP